MLPRRSKTNASWCNAILITGLTKQLLSAVLQDYKEKIASAKRLTRRHVNWITLPGQERAD
jgi:hypothetical protein